MDTLGAWGRGLRVQGIPYLRLHWEGAKDTPPPLYLRVQLDQIGDHEKSVMFVPGKVSDSHLSQHHSS